MPKTQKNFKVKRVLNNSSIIINDLYKEYVIISKGIGFGIKTGDTLPKGTVYDRVYKFSPGINQFSRLTNGYDDEIIEMVMDTLELMVAYDDNTLQGSEILSISDHLSAAYTRILNNEAIKSFFSFEIQALYPQAFERAREICSRIEDKYKIIIPVAEVSYIALHIQNITSSSSKKAIEDLSAIISEIYDLLTVTYHYEIDQEDLNYLRFITHLRFLVEGTRQTKRRLTENVNAALFDSYPQFIKITENIVSIIEDVLEIELFKEENTYIMIHLVNMLDEIDASLEK